MQSNYRLRCTALYRIENTIKKYQIPLLFLVSMIVLCFRAQYGYFFNDEPFIVSLAQRLRYGMHLVVDEWNFTQNFGVIILPLYTLYLKIFGSSDGILLAFRMVYCFAWVTTCITLYCIISKKYSGALGVFCYLILFSPLDQMTLSYTSVSLMCCLLLGGLFFYHLEIRPLSLSVFSALFAFLSIITVISLPFLAAAYVLVVISSFILYLFRKTDFTRFFLKVTLISSAIAVLTAGLYAYHFIFSSHSLAEFLENISYMFSITAQSKVGTPSKYVTYVTWLTSYYRVYGTVLLLSIFAVHLPVIRKSYERKAVIFLVDVIFFLIELGKLYQQKSEPLFNYQMLPIVFLGIAAFFMLENKQKFCALFLCFSVWGAVYSLFYHLSSDTAAMGISMGFSVSGVASIVYLTALYQEFSQYYQNKICMHSADHPVKIPKICLRVIASVFAVIMASQFMLQAILKVERHYWDVSVRYMDSSIPYGPGRGIKTEAATVEAYITETSSMHRLLKHVDYEKKDKIKFVSLISNPILYLDADLPVGAFSAWTFTKDEALLIKKMSLFYSINPSQMPNVIFYKADSSIIDKIDFNCSDYQLFTDGEYRLLVSPEYVVS